MKNWLKKIFSVVGSSDSLAVKYESEPNFNSRYLKRKPFAVYSKTILRCAMRSTIKLCNILCIASKCMADTWNI